MLDEARMLRLADPAVLRWWAEIPTRFRDLDSNGHVNNVVVLSYVEEARLALRRRLTDPTDPGGGWRIAASAVRYLEPIGYPATLRIGTVPTAVGTTSFGLGYGLFVGGRCVAVAISRSVHVDGTGTKAQLPLALAAALRAALLAD